MNSPRLALVDSADLAILSNLSGRAAIANNQISRATTAAPGGATLAFSDADSAGANYVYDGAGRLIEAYLPGVTYGYGYAVTSGCPANAAGADTDRTSATVTTAAGSTTTGYCYDAADRLTSTSSTPGAQVSYDPHGNQLTDGAQVFGYDAADRLVRAEAPGSVDRYLRDPVDRLAARTNITPIVAGGTTSYAAAASGQVSFSVPAGSTAGDLFEPPQV